MTENLSSCHYCLDHHPFLCSCHTWLRAWMMLIFICASLLQLCSSPLNIMQQHLHAGSSLMATCSGQHLHSCSSAFECQQSPVRSVNSFELSLSFTQSQASRFLFVCLWFTLNYASSPFVNRTANGPKCIFWLKFLVCRWWDWGTKIKVEPPCGSVVFH